MLFSRRSLNVELLTHDDGRRLIVIDPPSDSGDQRNLFYEKAVEINIAIVAAAKEGKET